MNYSNQLFLTGIAIIFIALLTARPESLFPKDGLKVGCNLMRTYNCEKIITNSYIDVRDIEN